MRRNCWQPAVTPIDISSHDEDVRIVSLRRDCAVREIFEEIILILFADVGRNIAGAYNQTDFPYLNFDPCSFKLIAFELFEMRKSNVASDKDSCAASLSSASVNDRAMEALQGKKTGMYG